VWYEHAPNLRPASTISRILFKCMLLNKTHTQMRISRPADPTAGPTIGTLAWLQPKWDHPGGSEATVAQPLRNKFAFPSDIVT
jgi:hypothetical protein